MFAVAARERVTNLVIVGDSFAKPMIRTLDEAAAAGTPYDTSGLEDDHLLRRDVDI